MFLCPALCIGCGDVTPGAGAPRNQWARLHSQPCTVGAGYSRLWTAGGHLGQSSSCGAPCHSSRSSSITRPGSAPIWPYLRHQQSGARMRSSTSPPAVVDQPPVPPGVPHHAAVPRPRERGVLVVVIPAHQERLSLG